jgi:hypothetical protein
MIAEDAPITHSRLAQLSQLVCQAQVHARQVGAMFNRVSEQLAAEAGQDGAEGGWRPHYYY